MRQFRPSQDLWGGNFEIITMFRHQHAFSVFGNNDLGIPPKIFIEDLGFTELFAFNVNASE